MAEAMTTLGGGEEPDDDEEGTDQEESEDQGQSGDQVGYAPKEKSSQDKSDDKASGFRDGFKKGWDNARKKAQKNAGKAGKKVAKKAGEKAAQKALQKGAQAAASKGLGAALGTALGGPLGTILGSALATIATKLLFDKRVHLAMIVMLLIILMIIFVPAGGTAFSYMDGGLTGGTPKVNTDPSNPEHKKLIDDIVALTNQQATTTGTNACGKRLEFGDPKDIEMIKNGQVDYRILLAIKSIAESNSHIKISHVANLLSSIPANTIETHSTIEETYLDNISAHKDGMAFDIVEINCVYEKCTCSDKCGCKQIPVQVAWQNLGGAPSVAKTAGLDKVGELLGLPSGSLGGINADDMFKNTGLARLGQDLGISFENIKDVNSLETLMGKFGQSEIEKTFGLPSGSMKDQNSLAGYATSAGKQRMEDVLNLPPGSLSGKSSSQVFKSSGQQSVENELNLPSNILTTDPTKAYQLLKDQNLTSSQKSYIEKTIGWPNGTINNLMTSLKSKNTGATSTALISAGKDVLEQAFGLRKGEFDKPGSAPITTTQATTEEQKYSLPEGTFKTMIEDLKNGRSIDANMVNVGAPQLDSALNLPSGSVKGIIGGTKTPSGSLQESRQIYSEYDNYLASHLNITQVDAANLRSKILNGQPISTTCKSIGVNKFEKYLGTQPGTLTGLINGTLTSEDFLSQNSKVLSDMASIFGMSQAGVNALFSGQFEQSMINYGQYQIARVFGFSADELVSLISSGNLSAIIQNQAMQAIANILGVNVSIIGSILTGNINVTSLISIGVSILYGGGLGSIFGGVFGGVFGGSCSTNCYKTEAEKNIRAVLGQALDLSKANNSLKPTQIITYKQSDVDYYAEKVDSLYGADRQPNYGLFTRPEAKAHIHIGY